MKIQNLGHVVLRVRSRARSEAFYHGVLGLPVAARSDKLRMTFFSLGGTHHDLAIAELGEDAPLAARNQTGLAHVAFKIGDSLDALKQAKADLDAAGIESTAADHVVSKSLYLSDPDGNRIELYVDQSDVWKQEPDKVASYEPLTL
ncbi:VOC family protein [soil metagenome]